MRERLVAAGARAARHDVDEDLELAPIRFAPAPAKRTAAEAATTTPLPRADPAQALAYARWLLGPARGWQPVHRRAEVDAAPEQGALAGAFAYLAETTSSATALPPDLAHKLTESFGIDASAVRIHTDDRAAAAAALLRARAFTLGADIYFAAGAYDPQSEAGLELIAHEIAHVAQHLRGQALGTGEAVSRPGDAHELEADELARRFLQAQRRSPPARGESTGDADSASLWGAPVRRQPAPVPAAPRSLDLGAQVARKPAPGGAPAKAGTKAGAGKPAVAALPVVVDLLGKPSFEPTPELAAHLQKAGAAGAEVRVRLGSMSSVSLVRVKKSGVRYVTVEDTPQVVPLSHSLFVPAPGLSPVVRVRIGAGGSGSAITGYLAPAASPGSASALARSVTADPAALGLRGFELPHATLENQLSSGTLSFGTHKPVRFELGGWVHGDLTFGLVNQHVTFEATANLHARGLRDAELRLSRDGKGLVSGSARLAVDLGDKFSGAATATYRDGDVAISGELSYASEKFRGKLGLMVADVAAAEQMVRAQLDPLGVQPISGVGGSGGVKPAPARGASGKKGERGIAGWGALDFAFTDWLVGKAQVVYGPTGHLTVVGKIAPPQRLDLMKTPKGIKKPVVPETRIEASYGLPYVADVHVGIGVSLDATAELGPVTMTDLAIEGVYSTDPTVMNAFSITGALRAQAQAGLSLDVKGYAGLRVLKHSVNFGAAIKGDAGIKAYAEARPTLGYREVASPTAGKQGEYYLKGHLEMAAQPVLALGGRLFIELDSPWWSPAPDKTWEWPLGKLEYPMPTQLGVGADIDYVVGSGQWPELSLTQPSFNPSKFVDTMMDDKLPAKGGHAGTQQKQGQWQGVAPTKPTAAPPTVARKPAAAPKADTGAGTGKPKKGKQTPEEKKSVPQSKDVAARWSAGMEAIGELRKRSEKDPETQAEIQQHLADLKTRHGFTRLSADRSGDHWLVNAAMNPEKKDIPIKADPREQGGAPATAAKGPRLAALAQALAALSAGAAEASRAHPSRSALEARCRELGAQHGATVRISSPLKTGVSRVQFSEKNPAAGQPRERLEAEISFVGRTDGELHERAGEGKLREIGVRERGGPGADTALVNVGDRSMAQNPNFEAEARAFEDKFGALAWRHPAANAAAAEMAARAKAYLTLKVGAWDEANAELTMLCAKIGADNPGWSGAVGTAVQAVMACFDGGNIAERMNHVGAFHVQILAKDLLERRRLELRGHLESAGLAADALMKRRKIMLAKQTSNVWDIAPVNARSQASGQWHARADRADVLGVPRTDEQGNPNHRGRAEMARSDRTLAETGATLSPREEALQRRDDPSWDVTRDTIKWQEGVKVWTMNERDAWVQWQRLLSLPVGAGPSGTTNQLMHAARDLKVERYAARAACIAYLLPAHHHTLVEILAAANPFDCGYTPGQRMYREIRPFTKEELSTCGRDGKFPDELADAKDDQNGPVTLRLLSKGGAP